MKTIQKSKKLADVCYDIRGPVLEKARQMEEEGHKIIKLNIGNLAPFGFDAPDEIVQDMIRNMGNAAGYTDSKGLFAPRKAIMHYTQQKAIKGVTLEDIYVGNGVSELIVMAMNALLDGGDEVLVPDITFVGSATAVHMVGATPVIVEVNAANFQIDTAAAARMLTPRAAIDLNWEVRDLLKTASRQAAIPPPNPDPTTITSKSPIGSAGGEALCRDELENAVDAMDGAGEARPGG